MKQNRHVSRGAVRGLVLCLSLLGACSEQPSPSSPAETAWKEAGDSDLSAEQAAAKEDALDAVAELQTTLLGEVVKGMEAGGPADTIRVCSELAPKLSGEVGQRHNVRIGRTSHRLRNPDNVGPDWMTAVVDSRRDETVTFAGPEEAIRLAIPIHVAAPCLVCHGAPGTLAPGVAAMLKEQYPHDAAVGFAEGDLRGWFWVETN